MSYDVELVDDTGEIVKVERHEEGGTYVLGGSTRASLNVTYNYGKYIYEALPQYENLRDMLDGKKASEVIDPLMRAVAYLGTDRDEDYWSTTKGNAGYALNILLDWAKQHPQATFRVD